MSLTPVSVLAQAPTTAPTTTAPATTAPAPGPTTAPVPGQPTTTAAPAPAAPAPAIDPTKEQGVLKVQECLQAQGPALQQELQQKLQTGQIQPAEAQAQIKDLTIRCFDEYVLVTAGTAAAEEAQPAEGETTAETAETEEKSGAQIILPVWNEVIWAAIAFIVLFGLLAKFAFPAMKKALQKRSDTIQDDLTKAEQAKLEAEGVLEEYRTQLANARGEAARIIEEARKQGDDLRKDVLAKADEDARSIREANARDVANAVEQAKAELRGQVAELSIELAGRLIQAELDTSGHQQLIDRFIENLDVSGAQS